MGIFSFKRKDKSESEKGPKGFFSVRVEEVKKLTDDSVQIVFDLPSDLKSKFQFVPGQYINIAVDINGKSERRSYSICSSKDESLSIAVKAVKDGKVSNWVNDVLRPGDHLWISSPEGNFKLDNQQMNIVCIAAGSGITPILSMIKTMDTKNGTSRLLFGNRYSNNIMFQDEIQSLNSVNSTLFLSGEDKNGFRRGRINKDNLTEVIKEDLDLLKADAFFICGPEGMIKEAKNTLTFFGVPENKVKYELFTVSENSGDGKVLENDFSGMSHIKVILDDEIAEFDLDAKGKTILTAVESSGLDAPYSCRGGVCCSCKAKVLQGNAVMRMNYSLTEEEIAEGYILTCQAHPASEKVVISFDE
jgi:ring-1,2-phenylacetyl-CoA epoxidase subunit PaaE